MKKIVEGLYYEKIESCVYAKVDSLTDQLVGEIEKRLISICYGEQYSLLDRGNYTYKRTVKEFVKRLDPKPENIKTGMVGELVVHLVVGLIYPEYRTLVPYFNLEERGVKKGFDSIIYSAKAGMWATEVKSSSSTGEDIGQQMLRLIQIAHTDITGKLTTDDENIRLWGSAMNGFQAACGHLKDEKKILQNIIMDFQDRAQEGELNPKKYNVILSSVLVGCGVQSMDVSVLKSKYNQLKGGYGNLLILSVSKSMMVDLLAHFRGV